MIPPVINALIYSIIHFLLPKQTCDTHVAVEICKKTDKLANKKCPKSERIKKVYIVRKNGSHGKTADTKFLLPKKYQSNSCTMH